MADWAKIKAEYIRDESMSYRKLCDKYDVPFSTLRKRAERERWPDLRAQKEHKRDTRTVDTCATHEADKACRFQDAADILLERIIQLAGADEMSARDVRALSGALRDLHDVKGILSDRDAREQDARIRKLEREAAGENADSTLQVVIGREAEDYCG